MAKKAQPYLIVNLRMSIKNKTGPGLRSETWNLNRLGNATLVGILYLTCRNIINMALQFMPEDEVKATIQEAASQIGGMKIT